MTKLNRYKNNTEPKIVVKGGITYKILDLGGSTLMVRVKSEKEIAKDHKEFEKYRISKENK